MNMNNEEREIRERFGKLNHFTVPEGYFERLTQQVMERVPEQEAKRARAVPMWRKYRIAIVAAACTLFAVFGVRAYRQLNSPDSQPAMPLSMDNSYANNSSFLFDEMVDYTMIDSDIIYASLSDSDY